MKMPNQRTIVRAGLLAGTSVPGRREFALDARCPLARDTAAVGVPRIDSTALDRVTEP